MRVHTYTQEEFDEIPRDEYGWKNCPSGDYTHIKNFPSKCVFGPRSVFGDGSVFGEWDLLIAHPPCTYLSNAGARWLYKGKKLNNSRYELGLMAKDFFLMFLHAQCNYIAVENPIPSTVFNLPNYSQIIQPYEHGEPWSKKTCLWLKNLPIIYPTNMVENYRPFCTSGSYSKLHDQKYKGASRKGGSAKSRSKTFPGIARAFAEQWSDYILKQNAGE